MPRKPDEFESLTLLDEQQVGSSRHKPQQKKVTVFLSAALAVFFLVDIVAFASIAHLILSVKSSLHDDETMEFRNPYIGLDELYRYHDIRPSPYGKLVNEPKLATQVSSKEPNKIFPVDLHRWLSRVGLLSPPDRRLQVASDIHTIAQFNVLDYGMEKCAISFRLPARSDVLPHPFTLPESGDTVRLDVCQLDSQRPFKESTLSWANKPRCIKQLPTVEAKIGGEVELEKFDCKSGSYLAYQISCAQRSPDCGVDVWTNHNQTWGFYINQYQTV